MCGLWNYTKLQLLLQHILSCYRWKYDILKFLWRSCSPKPGWVMPKLFARVCVWKGFMRVVVPSKGRPSSYDLVAYMNTIAASNPSFLPSTTTTAALSSLITWSCLEKFRYVVRVNQRTLNNGLSYLHMIWTIGKKCLTAFDIQCIMKVEIEVNCAAGVQNHQASTKENVVVIVLSSLKWPFISMPPSPLELWYWFFFLPYSHTPLTY